jgi:hypothetical protein
MKATSAAAAPAAMPHAAASSATSTSARRRPRTNRGRAARRARARLRIPRRQSRAGARPRRAIASVPAAAPPPRTSGDRLVQPLNSRCRRFSGRPLERAQSRLRHREQFGPTDIEGGSHRVEHRPHEQRGGEARGARRAPHEQAISRGRSDHQWLTVSGGRDDLPGRSPSLWIRVARRHVAGRSPKIRIVMRSRQRRRPSTDVDLRGCAGPRQLRRAAEERGRTRRAAGRYAFGQHGGDRGVRACRSSADERRA